MWFDMVVVFHVFFSIRMINPWEKRSFFFDISILWWCHKKRLNVAHRNSWFTYMNHGDFPSIFGKCLEGKLISSPKMGDTSKDGISSNQCGEVPPSGAHKNHSIQRMNHEGFLCFNVGDVCYRRKTQHQWDFTN